MASCLEKRGNMARTKQSPREEMQFFIVETEAVSLSDVYIELATIHSLPCD